MSLKYYVRALYIHMYSRDTTYVGKVCLSNLNCKKEYLLLLYLSYV